VLKLSESGQIDGDGDEGEGEGEGERENRRVERHEGKEGETLIFEMAGRPAQQQQTSYDGAAAHALDPEPGGTVLTCRLIDAGVGDGLMLQ